MAHFKSCYNGTKVKNFYTCLLKSFIFYQIFLFLFHNCKKKKKKKNYNFLFQKWLLTINIYKTERKGQLFWRMDTKDFSELPDVIWVKIMTHLSLLDRRSVALTCHTLNDAFNHPSLWYKATISLLASTDRTGIEDKILISKHQVELIERFGQYFQNLNLSFLGYVSAIPPHVVDVLTALSQNCRFETLTLSVGTVLSKRDFYWKDRIGWTSILSWCWLRNPTDSELSTSYHGLCIER